jgi:hypothetical protein
MVMRIAADEALTLSIAAGDREIGTATIEPGPWAEITVPIPASVAAAKTPLTVTPRGVGDPRFHSFHYWFYAAAP